MKFTCGGAIVLDRERGNEMDCLQLLMIVGGHTFTNKELKHNVQINVELESNEMYFIRIQVIVPLV